MPDSLNPSLCPTCGHDRPDRFCPACGEGRVGPDAYTVRGFLRTAAAEESPVHGRTVRTLITLFRRPGQLTRDYLIGRRLPYISPLRLYLLISVLFFFIVPHTGLFRYRLAGYEWLPVIGDAPQRMVAQELERTGESYQSYERRFNRELAAQRKTMMVFLVPMLALGMMPLFRRRHYGEHLVFSTHYFAALLLYMGVAVVVFFKLLFMALRALAQVNVNVAQSITNILETELALIVIIFGPATWYLTVALRRAYDATKRHAVLAAVALLLFQAVLIVYFYRAPLFFTTFYALKFF